MDIQGVSLEQLIAGALLKFDELDNFDISLLISRFEREEEIPIIDKVDVKDMSPIRNYIKVSSNGVFSFTSGFLSDTTANKRYVRKKILPSIAGEVVSDYFHFFSIEAFKKEKLEKLLSAKQNLLGNLNILLISDTSSSYEALLDYGFHHIDYFRSIVRASKYFKEERKELEKYHMVLIGSHIVEEKTFLEQLKKQKDCLLIEIEDNRLSNGVELSSLLNDYQNYRSWVAKESTYSNLLDRITECLIINQVEKKQKKYYPVKIEQPKRIKIPMVKKDLKILYLDVDLEGKDVKSLRDELELDIEFSNKDIRFMENRLGDFDIIIASKDTSNKLLKMSGEVREQAIDTGRTFSLLVTYQNQHIYSFDEDNQLDTYGYGSRIHLNYIVNESSFSVVEEMEFHHLYDKIVEEDTLKQFEIVRKKSVTKGVVEASVSLYNDCLRRPISDIHCKDADTFDREYLLVENKEKKRQLDALKPIYDYDRLKSKVEEYLKLRKEGSITPKLNGLAIVELPDSIYIKTLYEHKPLCAMTIPKIDSGDNLREFYVQTAKNGVLNEKEKVGLYTRKYESLPGVAERPNEEQIKLIQFVEKKVDYHISPLLKNSWTKVIQREPVNQENKTKKKRRHRRRKKKQ